MHVPTFLCRRWSRLRFLALPAGLFVAGCVAPQLTNVSTKSINGLLPSVMRHQKADEVVPASAVALPPTTLADGNIAVRAIAYVNNAPIFENEWREAVGQRVREYAELPEPQRSRRRKQIEQQELDRLIEREVILDTAMAQLKKMKSKLADELQREAAKEYERRLREIRANTNIQTDEGIKELFASQGVSLESFRRQIERSFITMEYMRNLIFPKIQNIPLSEIRDYYEAHAEEFQEQDRVKWQALFVDASKFATRAAALQYAEQVSAALRAGQDFAAVAKQLRQHGVNILLSDAGVGEKRGEIQPREVEAPLLQLGQNETSAPIEMPGGYYIVKTTERVVAGKRPLNVDVQADIRRKLSNAFADREYRRLVEEMKAKAVIQKLTTAP